MMMGFLNPVGFVFQVLKHAMTSGLYVDVEATDNCGMLYLNYSNFDVYCINHIKLNVLKQTNKL